jgi:hypothetical protein
MTRANLQGTFRTPSSVPTSHGKDWLADSGPRQPGSRTLARQSAGEIAPKTNGSKDRLHDKGGNRPQDNSKNRPDIINPISLSSVIDEAGLKASLNAKKQAPWCSRVRLHGLLLLIDYICRHLKNGRISISADLAHQFISKLRNSHGATMITEPLLLLCELGILEKLRSAVFAGIKTSAVYRFAGPYGKKRLQLTLTLTPKLAQKRASASDRCDKRLNRKFPWRQQLFVDLRAISFPDSARRIIASGLVGEGRENLTRLLRAVDAEAHFIKVSERGQITTSITSCPRELQPHLLLGGKPTAFCDISNAHWNFLPLILANRLDYVSGPPDKQKYINDGWREHNELVGLLSGGDFYRTWCVDPQNEEEREGKKAILNLLLNSNNEDCERNSLYRRVRAEFPITFRIIEDIKRKDRRNLSKQLQRFTADAVAAALREVQREGITAIPHVDALICQDKDRELVCEAIGRQVFHATGVCCRVGDIRYSPLTEIEEQALAFDKVGAADESMSHDNWEAMRLVKCLAAMKLMRRCPALFLIRVLASTSCYERPGHLVTARSSP